MISLPAGSRIWLVAGITDMRNGFNGLASKGLARRLGLPRFAPAPVLCPAPARVPAVFHQGQPAQSALSAAAATVGGSESLPVILRQDEVSEELMISINALPGLCVIVLWCTVNGQFIPQSQ